ncbi:hypothetical protein QTP88_028088 [Uroleucon formosanum]
MDRDLSEKWQRVADLIFQLGLVPNDQDQPRTAAQVAMMTTRHLLQDPVRAAIYNRGWADRTTDIERRLRPQLSTAASSSRSSSTKPTRPQPTTVATHRAKDKQAKVPGPSGVSPTPAVKIRMEAQLARNKGKFQLLKEKVKEHITSQKHKLAKHPAPTLEPEAASQPLSETAPPTAMEVDVPATKDGKSEEPEPSIDQASPTQTAATESLSENVWLETPGLSLEELPEVECENGSFLTPVGSPIP